MRSHPFVLNSTAGNRAAAVQRTPPGSEGSNGTLILCATRHSRHFRLASRKLLRFSPPRGSTWLTFHSIENIEAKLSLIWSDKTTSSRPFKTESRAVRSLTATYSPDPAAPGRPAPPGFWRKLSVASMARDRSRTIPVRSASQLRRVLAST